MKKLLGGLLAASLFTFGAMSLSADAAGSVTDGPWGTTSAGTATLEAVINKLVMVDLTAGDLDDVISPDGGGNPVSAGNLTFTGQIKSNYSGNVDVQLSGDIDGGGFLTLSGVANPGNTIVYNFSGSTVGGIAIGGPDFVATAQTFAITPATPVALNFFGALDGTTVDFSTDLADTYTGDIIITATAI